MSRIELIPPPTPTVEAANHYERSAIHIAQPGQPIARVVEGDPRHAAGQNVVLDPDGVTLRAASAGRIVLSDNKVAVESTLEINGNVDFAVGNIDFPGDIVVHGNIIDLFQVASAGSIYVDGSVENANVRAANNLHVLGGIVARQGGKCTAGGWIDALHIAQATVEAGGDLTSARGIANSRIVSGGAIRVPHGPIIAGHLTALAGVSCHTLGSNTAVPTLIETGVDELFQRTLSTRVAYAQSLRAKAARFEENMAPFFRRSLRAQIREKTVPTGLLFDAYQMVNQALAAVEELKSDLEKCTAARVLEVSVQDVLRAGVTLRFPGVQTQIQTSFQGPLKVISTTRDHETRIILKDASGSHPLPVEYLSNNDLSDLTKLLAA